MESAPVGTPFTGRKIGKIPCKALQKIALIPSMGLNFLL